MTRRGTLIQTQAEVERQLGARHLTGWRARAFQELKEKVADITAEWDATAISIQEEPVNPRRTDVDVSEVTIAWLPHRRLECEVDGSTRSIEIPAY